jgi:hypothetical protein
MDGLSLLLATGLRHAISAPNVEAGYRRIAELTGGVLDQSGFEVALASALRDGLIREPVRLPEGALQCHWRLELTPKGLAAARALLPT